MPTINEQQKYLLSRLTESYRLKNKLIKDTVAALKAIQVLEKEFDLV